MMRIDGLSTSYPLDRTAREGGAVTPYRESQRVAHVQREQPPGTVNQGQERPVPPRQADPGSAAIEARNAYYPARFADSGGEPSLSSRAAQALASYASTANLSVDTDADEVLGLDLYA